MGMPCVSCTHSNRAGIDSALVAGRTLDSVGKEFGLNVKAVGRHRRAHLSPALVAVSAEARLNAGRTTLHRVEDLAARVERVMAKAEAEGREHTFLQSARELRASVELLAKLTGELRPEGTTVQVLNVTQDESWVRLRSAILVALAPYPEARLAVAEAVRDTQGGEVAPRQLPAATVVRSYPSGDDV